MTESDAVQTSAPGERSAAKAYRTAVQEFDDDYRRATQSGYAQAPQPPLRGHDFLALVNLEIKAREILLGAFLTEGSLGMIHAWRGLGKTWFSYFLAFALSVGKPFLNWRVPKARRVLLIDGEMQGVLIRDRLLQIRDSFGATPEAGYLDILSRDLYTGPFIDISNVDQQLRLEEYIHPDTGLIVFDNLSSLANSQHSENDDQHWQEIANMLLRLRSAGRAVLVVHHSGKGGRQRGTSKREDLLDYVISLKRPPDYDESQGCRFILEFEKARSLVGDDIKPIDAMLTESDMGVLTWAVQSAESAASDRAIQLWELGGLNLADIAKELDVHKSTISRHLKHAQAEGKLTRQYPNGKSK